MTAENLKRRKITLGTESVVEDNVFLGYPPFGSKEGELRLIIGNKAHIRTGTVIYADTKIGHNFQCGHNVVIREKSSLTTITSLLIIFLTVE